MRSAIRVALQRLVFLGTAGVIAASVAPVTPIHLSADSNAAVNAFGGHCKGARWSFSPALSTNT
jgi:hypothetical protein